MMSSAPFNLFGIMFFAVFVFILVTSGFVFFNVNRVFRTALKSAEQQLAEKANSAKAAEQSEAAPAAGSVKCANCGAGLEQPEERSPDGKLRCAYCHQWTNA